MDCANLPELIGEPDLKKTYRWFFKETEYAVLSCVKGCRAWKKEKDEKFFSPTVIFYPLIHSARKNDAILPSLDFFHKESRRQYKLFIDSIPQDIKLLITRLGKYQYTALEAIYYVNEFKDFLKQELKSGTIAYIISVWELANVHKISFCKRISLIKEAMYCERCKIISSLLDLPCKKNFLKILNHFYVDDIDRDLLLILYYFSKDEKLYTALINNTVFKKSCIKKIYSELPDWLITPEIISALNELPEHIHSLKAVFPPIILDAEPKRQKEILKALKGANSYYNLEDRFASITQNLILKQPFPLPPFGDSKNLEAIKTGQRLKKEGLQMHNCVAGYVDEVLEKKSYFYHWNDEGKKHATVQLICDRYKNWYLEEALGFNNAPLGKKTILKLKQDLIGIMPDKKLPIEVFSVAGTFYYEAENLWNYIDKQSKIILEREPENEYDDLAIVVFLEFNDARFKLGYIPRSNNFEIAKLMDKGQKLRADVMKKKKEHSYHEIFICVSLILPLIES